MTTVSERIPPDAAPAQREDMLLLVDFKWLMAGLGWWVDLARLRRDPSYARECLTRGCASKHGPLQRCAQRLLAQQGAAA